ncbi:MAG TPA: glycosyltransferase family 39 protein [Thermoanaerobaculia bacterium]|jgi:4-amino-4-deoxy-L-arabinose transferase|nr:glycosyltransferase family 39 protein [Thermoanaerobaculia bacterium]
MLNLITGSAVFAVLFAAGALAFHLYRRGRPGAAALVLMAAGLLLRVYAGADLFLHPWDERYHALVAKHMADHPLRPTLYEQPLLPFDLRNWRANHVWLHKPPLALWLMAASLRVFGVSDWALRLPSLLLSALSILLTYDLGRRLFDAGTGLGAAGLHAIHGYLIALAAGRVPVDHIDCTLIAVVELGVWLAVLEGGEVLVGLVTGIAVLTKWLPGLLIVPVWLAVALVRERPRGIPPLAKVAGRALVLLAVATAVALPWTLYTRAAFPREAAWEAAYNAQHFTVAVEDLTGSPFFYVQNLPHYFGGLIYLPLLWLAWRLAKRQDIASLAPLAVWIFVPFFVFSLAATKMTAYVFTAGPALLLVAARFWTWLARHPKPFGGRWVRGTVLALLILLPLVATVERVKPWPDYDRSPAWAREIKALPARLGPGRVVLFNLEHPLEAMFYTSYVAYRKPPTVEQARFLRAAGWRVVALDRGDLPADVRSESGIEILPSSVPFSRDKPEDELPLPPL